MSQTSHRELLPQALELPRGFRTNVAHTGHSRSAEPQAARAGLCRTESVPHTFTVLVPALMTLKD